MGKNRIFFAHWTPAIYWSLVSKPVSQDIQSICYCLHTGTFRLDTRDLLVAGVPISISSKYLYLYLALKLLTLFCESSPDSSQFRSGSLEHTMVQFVFFCIAFISCVPLINATCTCKNPQWCKPISTPFPEREVGIIAI